jgi:hypothetical protein
MTVGIKQPSVDRTEGSILRRGGIDGEDETAQKQKNDCYKKEEGEFHGVLVERLYSNGNR